MDGTSLKAKRKEKGWTQSKLASLIGVSKNTVVNYEKGKTIPDSKKEILKSVFVSKEVRRNPLENKKGVVHDSLLKTAEKSLNPSRYLLQVILETFHPIEILHYLDEKRSRFENLEEFSRLLDNNSAKDDLEQVKSEISELRKMIEKLNNGSN